MFPPGLFVIWTNFSVTTRPKKKSNNKTWIAGGIVAVLLILFALSVDWEIFAELMTTTNWLLVLVATLFLLIGYALITVRWRYLLANRSGFKETHYADSIGYMVNMVTPVPAMFTRTVTTSWTTPVSGARATSSMIIERLLEMILRVIALLLLIALKTTNVNDGIGSIISTTLYIILAFAALSLVLKYPQQVVDKISRWTGKIVPRLSEEKVRSSLAKLLQGLEEVSSTRQLITGLLIGIVMWGFFLVFQTLVAVAMLPNLPTINAIAMGLAVLTVIPPSTPAMFGLYQAAAIGGLLVFGLGDATTATSYSILLYLPQLLCWLLLGSWAQHRTHLKLRDLWAAVQEYRDAGQSPAPTADATVST